MIVWNWQPRIAIAAPASLIILLFVGCATKPPVTSISSVSTVAIPAPSGLRASAPNGLLAATIGKMVGQSGEFAGCFETDRRIQVQGVPHAVEQPLEYAFAVRLAARSSGPFTHEDIESNLASIKEEWKNYPPLWEQRKAVVEQRVATLVHESLDPVSPTVAISLEQPLLVSIERVGEDSYAVVSIRRRKIAIDDNVAFSTAVDGTALTLISGRLLRLSLVRELQSTGDVEMLNHEIVGWIRAAGKNQSVH
jgi:hypothetical protein